MTITEWIKYEKLEKENQVLKNQLAEKDKEISKLKQDMADLECNQYTLESNQLFKEDFETKFIEYTPTFLFKEKYVLKDNSKYDKLPSKDVK